MMLNIPFLLISGSSIAPTSDKQQDAPASTTTDQSITTTSEGQQFAEGGKSYLIVLIGIYDCFFSLFNCSNGT